MQDFFQQPYVYTYESWVCIVGRFGSTNRKKQWIQYYVCLISVILIIPPSKVSRIDWYCTCIYPFWCIYPDILSQFISFTIATIEDIDWLTMKIRIDVICLVHLKIVCHWSRWHAKDGPFWKQQERPPYGAKNTQEYDEQHGRWWWQKKDRDQIWSGWLYVKNR